jgi:hypothetical protein
MALMPAPDYATEIAALEAGLGSGEARIESEGESITFRGVGDIVKAIGYFRDRAAAAFVAQPRSMNTLASYDPN